MDDHCCHVPNLKQAHAPKPRFGLALLGLFLAAISMLFSMPAMFGVQEEAWMPFAALASSAIVTLGLGWRFWLAIPRVFWKANMNTLVGLGIAAAYTLSIWQWSRGNTAHLYFDSAAFVAAFVLLGQEVEKWIQRRIYDQLPDWLSFLPTKALRKTATSEEEVSLEELKVKDLVIVRPGERVPVDAQLISETAELDESLVTGESRPVVKQKGALLEQGMLNLSQPIEVEVLKASAESFYQILAAKVEAGIQRKSDVQKKADRWAAILTPMVVLLAAGTAFYWGYIRGDWDLMTSNAISVLVIACPCVLGMATPISLFVGVIRSARAGILLNHTDAVERVKEVNVVAFDKTGTLTQGVPTVESIFTIENISQKDLLQWAGSLEQHSEHPYARAILKHCEAQNIRLLPLKEEKVSAGKGVWGRVERDKKDHEVCIGNVIWLFENGIQSTEIPENLRWEAEGSPSTVLWLSVDQKVQGIIILADQLREGARELASELREESYEVGLITGDAENVARSIAKELKLQFFHFGVVPEEKATIIRRLSEKKKKGLDFFHPKVAFVGDGINDGPALAEAHLGIALGSGTALAHTSADVILTNNDLGSIRKLFKILKETNSLLAQNLWLAFLYNLVALPIAAGVLIPKFHIHLDPGIAALAMSLSSVSLLLNSVRVLRR